MASKLYQLLPDGSDWSGGGSDWTLSTGSDLDALIAVNSTSGFISCTDARYNTVTIADHLASFESINWVKVGGTHQNTATLVGSVFEISLLNGGSLGNPAWAACDGYSLSVTSPSSTGKSNPWETPIFPFRDAATGGTAWTTLNTTQMKVKIESTSVSDTLKIPYMYLEVNFNETNPTAISTYSARNGLRVRKGKITIR